MENGISLLDRVTPWWLLNMYLRSKIESLKEKEVDKSKTFSYLSTIPGTVAHLYFNAFFAGYGAATRKEPTEIEDLEKYARLYASDFDIDLKGDCPIPGIPNYDKWDLKEAFIAGLGADYEYQHGYKEFEDWYKAEYE